MTGKAGAVGLLVAAALGWSSSGLLIKLVDWSPLALAGWRSLLAALVILLLTRPRIRLSLEPRDLLAGLLAGICFIAAVVSVKLTTAANAVATIYTAPVWAALLAPVCLGEPTRRRDWVCMALVLGGMALFALDGLSSRGLWGIAAGLVCAVTWAGAVVVMRRGAKPAASLIWGNLMAGLACQPFMYSGVPEWPGWLGVFALGALSSGVPYTLFARAVGRVSAVEATLIPSFEPLLNPLWVFLGQGERPGAYAIVGGLVVLLAVTVQGVLAARRC